MDALRHVDWLTVAKVCAAGASLLVALAGLVRGRASLHSKLDQDLDLLAKLPEGSNARSHFLEYVEGQVETFTLLQTQGARDWQGFVIAGFLVIGLQAFALWLVTLDGWWWAILAVVVTLFAVAGMVSMYDSAKLVPRDEEGKPL